MTKDLLDNSLSQRKDFIINKERLKILPDIRYAVGYQELMTKGLNDKRPKRQKT